MHLEPYKGRNVAWIKEFERAGGTHVIISHLPYEEVPVQKAEDFRKSFDVTVYLKERVLRETGVKAYATVGPYPAELLELERLFGLENAKEIMIAGIDIAAEYVLEGKAIAIGEVGRPHFPVSPEQWNASNEILMHAMARAKEVGCAVVLHTESATPENMLELARMADRVGLARHKVVKHYAPPLVLPEENHGLMPSVLAGKDATRNALSKGTRFMMETDFLDDPRRPGAVLGITTVPRRTKALIAEGLLSEEGAFKIHFDNARRAYGDAFV